MSSPAPPSYHERLQQAAAATRDLLAHSPVARWEVFAKASATRELEVHEEAPLQVIHSEEMGVAVRTFQDGRSGFAAASGLDASASRRATETALATETAIPIDPLPPARLLGVATVPQRRQLPPQGWGLHIAGELQRALAACSHNHLRLLKIVLNEGEYSWILTTADGFVATHSDASSSILVDTVVDGDRCGMWREWLHLTEPERFDPEAAASTICDRALLTHSPIGVDSGLRDVILHGETAAHLLDALIPLFVATAEDRDPLPGLLNRDGLLAAPPLGLIDERTGLAAPITAPCDGEGLPGRRILLVEAGVPRHRVASYRDALLCGEAPRGGALRISYRDHPSSGVANLMVITDSGLPPAELLAATDRALYLLRPVAPVTLDLVGDSYHLVASGVWLAGGRVRSWHPVVELHGSIGQLLRRIEAVGTDLRWYQGSRGFVGAPSILVRRQPVVG